MVSCGGDVSTYHVCLSGTGLGVDIDSTKCSRSYNQIYPNEGFAFVARVADTCSRMSLTFLRFIQFLAEQQADHALQQSACTAWTITSGMSSDAKRGQALVSCIVAIATAMRIVASVWDGPDVQRWRSPPFNQHKS